MGSFSASVNAWTRKTQRRTDAVIKTSAVRLAERAQLQGPSVKNPSGGKGGRMPIDEGFLRASFAGALGGMPTGPSVGAGDGPFNWDEGSITLTVQRAAPGDVIFMGWTAAYARKMEERYGFMKGAASEWQGIVNQAVREAKARIR